jgi:hypothetical protein
VVVSADLIHLRIRMSVCGNTWASGISPLKNIT